MFDTALLMDYPVVFAERGKGLSKLRSLVGPDYLGEAKDGAELHQACLDHGCGGG